MAYADPKGLTYCAYGVGTVYGPWSETLLGIWGDELDITGIDATWQGIKSALESGSMVVFGVGGAPVKTESGGQRYTDGHVMMAYKADGDKIWTKGSAEGGHVSYTEGEFGSIGCGAAFQLALKSGAKKSSKKSSKKKKKSSSKSSGAGSQANASRYVFIGDSRTNQMALCLRDSLRSACVTGEVTAGSKSPDGKDEFWIAKGSMGYPWFEETAVPAMDQNVKSGDAIIIWMGVNGAPSYVDEYATLVNAKAKEWKAKGATTYYASVGPMNGDMARQNGMGGSDGNVVKFNTELKAKLSSDVGWIDVYDAIKDDYGSPDGVHYDQQTYQKVYDTMTKGAVSSGGAEEEEDGEEGEEGTPINVDVTRA